MSRNLAVTKVYARGQIMIPVDFRLILNIQDGDYVRVVVEDEKKPHLVISKVE